MDAFQVEAVKRAKKRLQREETNKGAGPTEIVDAVNVFLTLDADTHPNIGCPHEDRIKFREAIRPLSQNLESVPIGSTHNIEDSLNEFNWNVLVEEVAHRVDEYSLRLSPAKRQFNHVRLEGQCEAFSVVRLTHGLEPLGHSLRIAEFTSGADLIAARDRVPCRLRPFDA